MGSIPREISSRGYVARTGFYSFSHVIGEEARYEDINQRKGNIKPEIEAGKELKENNFGTTR